MSFKETVEVLTDNIKLKFVCLILYTLLKRKDIRVPEYINVFYTFLKDTSQAFFPLQRRLGVD